MLKARIKFSKNGNVKFTGHLDVMRFFQKAIKRAGVDIAYSEGFSPHQIMSFASPLGVGITSDAEYIDVTFNSASDGKKMIEDLNSQMVEGLKVLGIKKLSEDAKTSMALVAAAEYIVKFREGYCEKINLEKINDFMSLDKIVIEKKTKRNVVETDIRPMIISLSKEGEKLRMMLQSGSVVNLKPDLLMQAFFQFIGEELPEFSLEIHRVDMYDENMNSLGNEGEDIL